MNEANISLDQPGLIGSEEIYQKLRAGIRGAFTMLVEGNRPLVLSTDRVTSFDDVLDTLEKHGGDRQHYTCQQCRSFWNFYERVYGVNPDGTLTSPIGMVMDNLEREYGVVFPRKAKHEVHLTRKVSPLHKLRESFTTGEAGGWEHFHGCDEASANVWMSKRISFQDKKFIEAFIERARGGIHFTPDNIAMLHLELKDKIRLPRAIGLLEPYAQLLATINEIKPKSLTTFLQIMLTEEQNSWIVGVDSSTAGIVLDELRTVGANDLTPEWITMVLGKVNAALDGNQYKQKTAPTNLSAVQQATAMLKDAGLMRVVERRYVGIEEVTGIWTRSTDDIEIKEDQPEVDTRSALEKAADEFASKAPKSQAEKNSLASAISARREVTKHIEQISLAAFINLISKDDTIARMDLSLNHPSGFILTVMTDSVDVTDYSAVLNIPHAVVEGRPFSTNIVSTTRLTGGDAVRHVILESMRAGKPLTYSEPRMAITKITPVIRNNGKSTPALIAHLNEVQYLRTMFGPGSMVLGTMIRQEYYGYSRAICQLSDRVPMTNTEVQSAGGLVIDVGTMIHAVKKDGTRVDYTITAMA